MATKKQQKELLTKHLIEEFELDVLNAEASNVDRVIKGLAIHRAGIELATGFKTGHLNNSIIGWGSDENGYLKSVGKDKALELINNAVWDDTPLILLSHKVESEVKKWIITVANRYKVPVVDTKQHLAYSTATIGAFLIDYFAPTEVVHASLTVVKGLGVMIIGESGVGKSEAVIELISKGHTFVADDSVVIKRVGHKFYGKSSEITKGMLESRGIGIIDIPYIYGAASVIEETEIDLVIELKRSDLAEFDRIGNKNLKYNVLKSSIPLIQIPVQPGRSMATLIEVAVNMFVSRDEDSSPLEKIMERSRLSNE